MGKFHRNNLGSVVLDPPVPREGGGRQFKKLWAASFRRIIRETVRCGTRHHKHSTTGSSCLEVDQPPVPVVPELPKLKNDLLTSTSTNTTATITTLRSELKLRKKSSKNSKNGALRSDKLSDLLSLPSEDVDMDMDVDVDVDVIDVKRKVEALEELKRVVKNLQQNYEGNHAVLLEGAREVRRLTKDDSEARTTLALLGAIPPLVALLDAPPPPYQVAALYALLNLGIGNDANKSAIVKVGAVHKMLKLIESANGGYLNNDVAEAIVANLLALTALDANKPVIGSSGAIPFLLSTLKDPDERYGAQAKQDALRALYNLSISPSNLSHLLDAELVPFLFSKLGDMDVSERILSILSNVVSISEGQRAISCSSDAIPTLIDVLNWNDSPGCQEKGSYILMVMAHKASGDRQVMVEAGITSSLLELTLIGTTLAQKRASRILEYLTVNKGKQVSGSRGGGLSPTLSAPICAAKSSPYLEQSLKLGDNFEDEDHMVSGERKAVKLLVQQSLQHNMNRIVRRANLPHDFVPSNHLKSLTVGSTSKSLPF